MRPTDFQHCFFGVDAHIKTSVGLSKEKIFSFMETWTSLVKFITSATTDDVFKNSNFIWSLCFHLTLSWRKFKSYRKQMYWFLYDRDLFHQRDKPIRLHFPNQSLVWKNLNTNCFRFTLQYHKSATVST